MKTTTMLVSALMILIWMAPTSAGAETPAYCPVVSQFSSLCNTQGRSGTPFKAGLNCRMADVDGFPREYLVYLPKAAPLNGNGTPVVFMLHGSGGDGEKFYNISGWKEKADAEGLIAVFPTALTGYIIDEPPDRCGTKWNAYGMDKGVIDLKVKPVLFNPAGRRLMAYPVSSPWPADDVKFHRTILSDLKSLLPVDAKRVFVSGFSNGASMTARLAVEMSKDFAAAAWSGGGLGSPAKTGLAPLPAIRIPVAMEFGACDPNFVPALGYAYDEKACKRGNGGGLPLDAKQLLANPLIADNINYHLDTFGLQHSPYKVQTSSAMTCITWSQPARGNTGGTMYRYAILTGVTHQYPNGTNNPLGLRDADRFWDFFTNTAACR